MANKENEKKFPHPKQEWNQDLKHFGEVEEGKVLVFTFKYLGDLEYLTHTPSCSCTTGKWENNELQAHLSISTGTVKDNMMEAGRFYSVKSSTITVRMKDEVGQIHTKILRMEAVVFPQNYKVDE